MKKPLIAVLVFAIGLVSCGESSEKERLVSFDGVQQYVIANLNEAVLLLDSMSQATSGEAKISLFKLSRMAFKKAEPFGTFISPESALRVNGPPLPVFREDNSKVLPPMGYQAIEETLFEEEINEALLKSQIGIAKGFIKNIISDCERHGVNERRFFAPVHQQFLRIFSLGLTGFDTPTSYFGIDESITCLQGIREVYSMSIGDTIAFLEPALHADFLQNIDKAVAFIEKNKDFETFDRYTFGRNYLNLLTGNWVDIRKTYGFLKPSLTALNLDAPTLFEKNSFHIDFFRLGYNRNPSDKKILLGKKLFNDPKLSKSRSLSCSSCHNPSNFYQDGLKKAIGKNGAQLLRNTPTLVNAIYQRKFFWDGRSPGLQFQITNVFDNELEFDNHANSFATSDILSDTSYQRQFSEAFPNMKFNRSTAIKAISAYVSTLNGMDSRFDRNMRGELDDFTPQEVSGMNLFMGKALCATCHFMPITNGTVPPLFLDTEKEVLGTPKTAENKEIDPDVGFYPFFEVEIHKFMFKTPTVRNVELTAPYMHNGVYETLEQVVDFYNKGGGGGMGFDLPHQTLPFDSLNLSSEEQTALVAFMKTFTDRKVEETY